MLSSSFTEQRFTFLIRNTFVLLVILIVVMFNGHRCFSLGIAKREERRRVCRQKDNDQRWFRVLLDKMAILDELVWKPSLSNKLYQRSILVLLTMGELSDALEHHQGRSQNAQTYWRWSDSIRDGCPVAADGCSGSRASESCKLLFD